MKNKQHQYNNLNPNQFIIKLQNFTKIDENEKND
ncbi:hypothetical protein FHS86_001403 [Roseimarinus sediminis]